MLKEPSKLEGTMTRTKEATWNARIEVRAKRNSALEQNLVKTLNAELGQSSLGTRSLVEESPLRKNAY